MSFNHNDGWIGIIGISFRFSLTCRYVVCAHLNRHIEVIQMRTHNIPISI